MADALLGVHHATKLYTSGWLPWAMRQTRAVDDVSLDLRAGETLGIVGESGSGKSTLLRLVLRLLRPTAGDIRFEGRDIARLGGADLKAMRRRLGAVFQDPASSFNPRQNIRGVLSAPLEVHDIGTRASRLKQVGDTLELVGLNAGMMERYPHQLSGGQRQRVAIARATIMRPALILADEPTGNLDRGTGQEVTHLLEELNAGGVTLIVVTHDPLMGGRARRQLLLEDGMLRQDERNAAPQTEGT